MTTTSREADWTMWMRAAVAGDSGAYRQFLHAVAPYIRAIARSRCRRLGILESEAEDIVQEVLLTIHLKQGTWDPSREIGPWLTAITRNKIIDVFRRRGRRIEVPIDDVMDSLQAEDEAARASAAGYRRAGWEIDVSTAGDCEIHFAWRRQHSRNGREAGHDRDRGSRVAPPSSEGLGCALSE